MRVADRLEGECPFLFGVISEPLRFTRDRVDLAARGPDLIDDSTLPVAS
jgi:hypothetical protein